MNVQILRADNSKTAFNSFSVKHRVNHSCMITFRVFPLRQVGVDMLVFMAFFYQKQDPAEVCPGLSTHYITRWKRFSQLFSSSLYTIIYRNYDTFVERKVKPHS